MKKKNYKEKIKTVEIAIDLHKEIKVWIKRNGNKYQAPTIRAFVEQAVYEKLKRGSKRIGLKKS